MCIQVEETQHFELSPVFVYSTTQEVEEEEEEGGGVEVDVEVNRLR